jgi:hypothetical protein
MEAAHGDEGARGDWMTAPGACRAPAALPRICAIPDHAGMDRIYRNRYQEAD